LIYICLFNYNAEMDNCDSEATT